MEVSPLTKTYKKYSYECCSKDFGGKKFNYLKHIKSEKHLKLFNNYNNQSTLEEQRINNITFKIDNNHEKPKPK